MQNVKKGLFSAKNVAMLAVLTAFVVLLQAGLGSIKIGPTEFSFVLIPIVLGSCLLGPLFGGFLGFVFSLIVFLTGVTGANAFTYIMFTANPFATTLIIFLKGILAGVVPGLLYSAISKKNEKAGIVVAALSAPVVNTSIFILLTIVFGSSFSAAFVKQGFIENGAAFMNFLFIGCAGINFIAEFAVNAVATPILFTVMKVVGKKVSTAKIDPNASGSEKSEKSEKTDDASDPANRD